MAVFGPKLRRSKQARHHSVLATAPPQRLGLDSTLAILEPRWWPCQIQVLSQKLTGGGPGRGRQVGRCPPKSAQFWAKNSHFSPKTAPVRVQNSETKTFLSHVAQDMARSWFRGAGAHCAYFGAFWRFFGPFLGHIVELEGTKGPLVTRKSSRTWSVPAVCLRLAVLNPY